MNKLGKMLKRTIGITLAVAMVVTSIPVYASELTKSDNNVIKVSEEGTMTVPYFFNGKTYTQEGCKEFTNNMSNGWYVLNKEVTTGDAVVIQGKVNLILADHSVLNAKNGIYITKDSELIIWAQSGFKEEGFTGTIIAHPDNGPGIGSVRDTMGGNLTINGGIIDCKGGTKAAGIGGGRGESSGFGNITINGGFVKTVGGDHSAGLGRGHRNWKFGVITINGGEVDAEGGSPAGGRMGGAGIGGSEDRGMPPVIINGGKVKAKGDVCGAGIGGGAEGHQVEKLTINGGDVTAIGFGSAAAIGGGGHNRWKTYFNGAEVEINGGNVTAKTTGNSGCAIGGGEGGVNGPITINGGTVNATFGSPMDFNVCRGCAIGSSYGDKQGGPITINGGVVNAVNEGRDPAIGGSEAGGNITINGGTVNAIAKQASGISGNGSNGSVKITGGNVTAVSNGSGAGIGCSDGGKVTISGGNVVASSGSYHDAIWLGGAYGGASAGAPMGISVAVSAAVTGIVYALSSTEKGGAGIGGENGKNGGNVKITGGTVVANSVLKGAVAIGRGLGGKSDGTLELYDSAEVIAGKDARNGETVKKEDRVSACRNDFFAVVKECTHEGATYKDENDRVHKAECPYCNGKGKDLVMKHFFNPETHKCVCGRTERKVDVHVEAVNMSKDEAARNIDIKAADTEDLDKKGVKDGESFYVVEGDMLTVTLKNTDKDQASYLTYVINGKEKNAPLFLYDKTVEGYQVYKYRMPGADCSLKLRVIRNIEKKYAKITYTPYAKKNRVYDGDPVILLYPGMADNGTIYYAIGDNDKEPPAFDGEDNSKKERTWNKEVPSAVNPGKYYCWYMVKGEYGYEDVAPVCITNEIKKAEVKPEVKVTPEEGKVKNETYTSDKKETVAEKKQHKASILIDDPDNVGEGKAALYIGDDKKAAIKSGDTYEYKSGDTLIFKIEDLKDLGDVQATYTENGKTKSLSYIDFKEYGDGSVFVKYVVPDNDVTFKITYKKAKAPEKKKIAYTAPKANTNLTSNGTSQALVKRGSTSDGTFYYALGKDNTTAPEFDGTKNNVDKVWNKYSPTGIDPGKYFVWYTIKGDDGYIDVEPTCIEVEIKPSAEQKKEVKTDEVTPRIEAGEANPYNAEIVKETNLEDVVEVTPEEKDKGVSIVVNGDDIKDKLDDEDKSTIEERFKEYDTPAAIDITVTKLVKDEEPKDVTNLEKETEVKIELPAKDVDPDKTYKVLRLDEDNAGNITAIEPTKVDYDKNEITFKTDTVAPVVIASKDKEDTKADVNKTPSLVSPRAIEGLYYSGEDMDLVIEGKAVGGTIYYALGENSLEKPAFDGLSNSDNKKWTTSVPKAKEVGTYNVWYMVKGDGGYTDLDGSCLVSEIKPVPNSTYNNVNKEKGKVVDITDHPEVKDNNANNAAIERSVKPVTPENPSKEEYVIDVKPEEKDEGFTYWVEVDDITEYLTDDDIEMLYAQYQGYYIGKLYDLTLTVQEGDEEPMDVVETDEPVTISFIVPEELAKSGRQYIIYMLEDDNDFFEPTVIYPSEYNESDRRLSFKTTTIKPFVLGYSDGEKWVNESYEIPTTVAKSFVYEDSKNDTAVNTTTLNNTEKNNNPTTDQTSNQTNDNVSVSTTSIKTPDFNKADYTTNLRTKSAKTGDDDIISIIVRIICNFGSIVR